MELIYRTIFTSWKTTLTGIVGALVWFLGQHGVVISPEQSQAVVVVALLIISFFAKDANKSHLDN
jgi:hypothetical protein